MLVFNETHRLFGGGSTCVLPGGQLHQAMISPSMPLVFGTPLALFLAFLLFVT